MDYTLYTAEDFAANESFINYHLKRDDEDIQFWENWKIHHPEKLDELYNAERLLDMFFLKLSDEELKTEFVKLEQFVKNEQVYIPKSNSKKHLYFLAVALTCFIAIGISWWVVKNQSNKQDVSMVQRTNPFGQRSIFELEDGTKVTLNANSSLTFPAVFDTNQRNVTLKGEAFFEVAKDKKRPFRVITGDIVTTVLGTKFNVNTNLLNKGVQIALVEGKVAVNYAQKNRTSVVLNPNEVLTFDQENNSLSKNNVDVNEFTGWKDGALKFKNASFNDVSNKLFHYYGIQLINKSNDTNWSYTGEFVNRDYLSIVKSICYAKKMKFNRFDNTIIIYK